jgi:hypothetical protein
MKQLLNRQIDAILERNCKIFFNKLVAFAKCTEPDVFFLFKNKYLIFFFFRVAIALALN